MIYNITKCVPSILVIKSNKVELNKAELISIASMQVKQRHYTNLCAFTRPFNRGNILRGWTSVPPLSRGNVQCVASTIQNALRDSNSYGKSMIKVFNECVWVKLFKLM